MLDSSLTLCLFVLHHEFAGVIFMTLMEDSCLAQRYIVHACITADYLISSLASWLNNAPTHFTGQDCLYMTDSKTKAGRRKGEVKEYQRNIITY